MNTEPTGPADVDITRTQGVVGMRLLTIFATISMPAILFRISLVLSDILSMLPTAGSRSCEMSGDWK